MRTLLLDDDPIALAVAEHCLASLGIDDAYPTTDAVEASDIIHNEQVDLILLDLNMPSHDGLAFLRSLSEIGYEGAIIIVSSERANVLSSSAHIGEKLGLNICGSLSKPINMDSLQRSIECAKASAAEHQLTESGDRQKASGKLKPALWYQPQIDARTGDLIGAEALLRGIDDKNSVFGPYMVLNDYLDIESRFDLTVELFEMFCGDVAEMRDQDFDIRFSFNVDATVLEYEGFAEVCIEKTIAHGLDPELIVIELIEAYLPQDEARLLEVIARLSMAGFDVAMDDFSSGAASFELLRTGAFSEIKLDMPLVKSSASNAASAKFICNAVSLAETLQTRIIAEGVETEDDVERLTNFGVREMQGFYFAKPAKKERLIRSYTMANSRLDKAS